MKEYIVLFFLSNLRDELNPIERVWQWLKEQLSWERFADLENRQDKVASN